MLKSLIIRNFVLIDELDISFDDGFSVITGETGAGKSIILGALALVLGERADSHSIRTGSDKCVIEASFDISDYHLEEFFQANEIDYDPTECLFRRELYASGKSRAFINDSPIALPVVKALGNKLIDIHSQHQNLMLAEAHFQLRVVDLMAHDKQQLADYHNEYSRYTAIGSKLDELREKARISRNEEDYIRFQFDELTAANLQAGEQAGLEDELETLSHAEEIKTALYRLNTALGADNASATVYLKDALASVRQVSPFFSKAEGYIERLDATLIEIDDILRETDVLKDDIEFSPERYEYLNQRLGMLYSLLQKHKAANFDELITRRDEFGAQLRDIDSSDEEIEILTAQQQESCNKLVKQAGEITALRRKASKIIEKTLTERMVSLGIPNTRFQIQFTPKSKPSSDGMDEIYFLFSANKNEELQSVAKTASGGEISRLMLCVKNMIAGYAALPSIIFDEIDTGVSGEIADKMAGIMRDMGGNMQVITITHLPQIAAKGLAHYYVYKQDTPERTLTRIRRLAPAERINEIAQMLSGATITPAA
ncbi:MAG: DNA repair protein RecN, partial [Tannerella sp.]|nr:DNA repair protein RecN [Tannerella sp.]